MAAFGCCAAATHLCSALTHVFPDSHTLVGAGGRSTGRWPAALRAAEAPAGAGCSCLLSGRPVRRRPVLTFGPPACSRLPSVILQEKFDHIGIVATIVGTPITALMVSRPPACLLLGGRSCDCCCMSDAPSRGCMPALTLHCTAPLCLPACCRRKRGGMCPHPCSTLQAACWRRHSCRPLPGWQAL